MRRLRWASSLFALLAIAPLACDETSSAPDLTYTPSGDDALAAAIYGRWEQPSATGVRAEMMGSDA